MSRYRNTMSELLKEVRGIKEQDKDHEVSMARGELEAIADKATQLASMLQGKSDDGNPLEAWVQSKITKAKDYINSVSDYMMYNPDMKQNESLEEGYEKVVLNAIKKVGLSGRFEKGVLYVDKGDEKKAKDAIDDESTILKSPKIVGEELQEKTYGWTLVSKAKDLAKKYANNYTKAVDEIEKLQKGLSKNPTVEKELMKYNEDTQRPSPAKPNSKELEEVDNYPTSDINKKKKDGYTDPKKGEKKIVDPEPKLEGRMSDIDAMRKKGASAEKIAKELRLSIKTVKDILGESNEDLYLDLIDEKVADSIIKNLQKSYADLKGKTISPEMANKLSKHLDQPSYDLDTLRQLVKANIPFVSTIARNKIYKKTGKFEGAKRIVETIQAVKNKAEKTGMPYSILKQVYDRGMAAWKGGHRPGATQQQWALARVNSFVTKSSGTWGGADSDLAAKVKGSKK